MLKLQKLDKSRNFGIMQECVKTVSIFMRNKKPVTFKLKLWILAGLDIVHKQSSNKTNRTRVMEEMLAKELSKHGLTEDSPLIQTALKKETKKIKVKLESHHVSR